MSRKGIMLCYPFEEQRLKKWKPPYLLQPKLDGDRCRGCIDSEGTVTLLSSEENVITSVPHINSALSELHLHDVEFDGELYIHGAPHEILHGIVSREVNLSSDHTLVEFHIFDIVNERSQIERTNSLLDTIPSRQTGRSFGPLQIVPSTIVTNIDEIMREQERFAATGYEGFVIRDMYAPYVRKRSTQMMKFKPRREDFYEIVGYEEEMSINKERKNALGALICKGNDETRFQVGSGSLLTRENRETMWQQRETLVGRWACVKYQHLTHARGVPRFPVVVDIVDNPFG